MAKTPRPWFRRQRKAWFVCIAGVQYNLGKTRKEAYDAYARLMRQPAGGKVSPHSLPAIADAFLDWVQKQRAPDTYQWYRYRLQRFVQRHADLRVGDLRPLHAQQWVDSYPGLMRNSRRNYLRAVKCCFAWAHKQGYTDEHLLRNLELPAQDRREVLITPDDYQALLSFIRNDSLRDLAVVTWQTGCWPQESLRVEARHVDLKNERRVFPPSEAKGERWPRIIYLTEDALEITKRLMLKHPEGPLFRNTSGRSWTPDAVNCAFTSVQLRMGKHEMKRCGITIPQHEIDEFIATLRPTRVAGGQEAAKRPAVLRAEAKRKLVFREAARLAPRCSLYALRHAWATRALETGLDALTVAVLMGHADPSTLAKVYQHLAHSPQYLLQQARRVASTA